MLLTDPASCSSAAISSSSPLLSAAATAASSFSPPVAAAMALAVPPSPPLMSAAASAAATAVSSALAWAAAHRARALVLALLGGPALALLQGMYFLSRYRSRYGDAPVPLVPCRGVVVSSDERWGRGGEVDALMTRRGERIATDVDWASRIGTGEMDATLSELGGEMDVTGSGGVGFYDTAEQSERGAGEVGGDEASPPGLGLPPLRLLVIGDSLAAGVGTSRSCTPVLPRSIASALSRDLGGRPVQWTCLGEPGASAGWIVRELEAHPTVPSESESESKTNGGGGEVDQEGSLDGREKWNRWWRDKLDIRGRTRWFQDRIADIPGRHPCLESKELDGIGRYDVAVVLTGPNDLKFAVLPFMLQGEDVEFRKQSRKRGGDYSSELRRVIDALVDKMKEGLGESMEKVRASVEESVEKVRSTVEEAMPEHLKDKMNWTASDEMLLHDQAEEVLSEWEEADSSEDGDAIDGGRPLVVLAALPAKNLPVLRWLPLRWLALALLGVVEGMKRTLAQRYPGAILYVDAPDSSSMRAFESRRGPLWLKRHTERTAVSVIDKAPSECEGVVKKMREYYAERDGAEKGGSSLFDDGDVDDDALLQSGNKASESSQRPRVRPGSAGATLLSADKLHPNDLGYDFWGRYIAKAVVDEWKSDGGKQK